MCMTKLTETEASPGSQQGPVGIGSRVMSEEVPDPQLVPTFAIVGASTGSGPLTMTSLTLSAC